MKVICTYNIYIYTVTTFKYTDFLNIRTGILDYLWEGFPWPARPFKHTESNSFKHAVTTVHLNIRTGISYYLRGLAVWPALHIFKCRYRINILIYILYIYYKYRKIYISFIYPCKVIPPNNDIQSHRKFCNPPSALVGSSLLPGVAPLPGFLADLGHFSLAAWYPSRSSVGSEESGSSWVKSLGNPNFDGWDGQVSWVSKILAQAQYVETALGSPICENESQILPLKNHSLPPSNIDRTCHIWSFAESGWEPFLVDESDWTMIPVPPLKINPRPPARLCHERDLCLCDVSLNQFRPTGVRPTEKPVLYPNRKDIIFVPYLK